MFEKTSIEFEHTGSLNRLVLDYLKKKTELRPFYNEFPDQQGLENAINSNAYVGLNRKQLSAILLKQADSVNNTSEASRDNIRLLESTTTFTVTTGHQLCLFTGPLYFIYKIFSAINLCRNWNEIHQSKLIPVFWMASEDHDFEEVNHLIHLGKKLTWNTPQTGAVGRFVTSGMYALSAEFKTMVGGSDNANYLTDLFKRAYSEHRTLADATRYLVNELFGEHGIVIIDGDDTALKEQLKPVMREDILQQKFQSVVDGTIRELRQLGHEAQVHPREINFFYMDKDLRSRIEKAGDGFVVVGTDIRFSAAEMSDLIEVHPDKLSPNVMMRPLYQQIILPNLAYVGGPGELAYWLEFKAMFDQCGTFFPVLVPRSFVLMTEKKQRDRLNKMGLQLKAIFTDRAQLSKSIQVAEGNVFSAANAERSISEAYDAIVKSAVSADPTLEKHVLAMKHRSLEKVQGIEKKINRALRNRSSDSLRWLDDILSHLFPGGAPQERVENFSVFYERYGKDWMAALAKELNPLDIRMQVIEAS